MNLSRACTSLLLVFTVTDAFTPVIHGASRTPTNTALRATGEKHESSALQGVFQAFGVAATVLAFSTAADATTTYQVPPMDHVVYSSSVSVSATIKTMDFSLPSSYDTISDSKSSATDELTVEENIITGTKRKKAAPKPSSDKGAGFSLGQNLTPEEKAAIAADKQAEREALAAEKVAIAAEKQAEKEAIAAGKAAEKAAKDADRAAEKAVNDAEKAADKEAAKKAAAKASEKKESRKADQKFAGAEFVDMGLPSYSDSASSSGKKDNPFAL